MFDFIAIGLFVGIGFILSIILFVVVLLALAGIGEYFRRIDERKSNDTR